MNNEIFQTFFDCGFSKVRAGTFNTNNHDEAFYIDSKFFTDIKPRIKDPKNCYLSRKGFK